jgi:uncharacterized membrane protein
MFGKFFEYLVNRFDEFSTWVAVIGLVLAILFLPKGLTAFIVVVIFGLLVIAPDTKFSEFIKKYFG